MQIESQNNEFMNAENDYLSTLNRVNLLLLKQHEFLLQKMQYEEELQQVNKLIDMYQSNSRELESITIETEYKHLNAIIKSNKKEINQLRWKTEKKQIFINQLKSLTDAKMKYEKLIDSQYQNGIQQKLSMIRGKVDDLKKKIKEINKDIISFEQEHSESIDQYSYQLKTLESYKLKNDKLKEQIADLRLNRKK